VSGSTRATACRPGDIAATGTKSPEKPSIGYRMTAPIDADHAAVGERGPSTPQAACEPSERHEDLAVVDVERHIVYGDGGAVRFPAAGDTNDRSSGHP
jgi:hypothetical protein